MKFIKQLILVVAPLIMGNVACASNSKFTISGYVRQHQSREAMVSASVFDTISKHGSLTNNYGFYSLTLPKGNHTLRYSFVGFETKFINIDLQSDTIINVYPDNTLELDEVVVRGQRSRLGVEGTQMSAVELPIDFIQKLPTMGGEIDVVKALQLLPGVQAGQEGTSGMLVRGGGDDENLILIDGVPLYNVDHLLGIFSAFNPDAIKNVTFYKGNFPARYGSRLSGVLDVRQKDGDARRYHGSATIGLLSAKATVEGPIWKDHTTFFVSARRSYVDYLAQPILGIGGGSDTKFAAGYYFYDVNARLSHKFSDKDRLTASFYIGEDEMYINQRFDDMYSSAIEKQNNGWGNILGAVNWNHLFSNTLFADATISYTRYRYKLNVNNRHEYYSNGKNKADAQKQSSKYISDYNSTVDDLMLQYSLQFTPNPRHNVQAGVAYTFHIFSPSTSSMIYRAENDSNLEAADSLIGMRKTLSHEAILYIEDDWSIHRKLKLNYGIRASIYSVDTKCYWSIEPRISLLWRIIKQLSLKASYAYTTQYVHMLETSNSMLNAKIFVPTTADIGPMHSHQAAAGLYYNLLDFIDFSVEGYYKTFNGIIDYKDGVSYTSTAVDWDKKVNIGHGWSYGIEFLAQRTIGKITGLVGYTWSKTFRQFDRKGMIINEGKPFYAPNDRRHQVTASINYRPIFLIDFGATFVYGTGACTTLATQKTPGGDPWITRRYNYRMPDYHRLDLAVNFHFKRPKNRHGEHRLHVGVYNVYNRMNPLFLRIFVRDMGPETDPSVGVEQVSLFPILPSLSYTFQF